jgi:hypothetical protein
VITCVKTYSFDSIIINVIRYDLDIDLVKFLVHPVDIISKTVVFIVL